MRFRLLWIYLTTVAFLILFINATLRAQPPGTLTNIAVTSNDTRAGEGAVYTLNFTTSASGNGINTGLPGDGKIRLQFPEGFDVTQTMIAHSTDGSINGGFSSIDITTVGVDTFIDLSRDNTGNTLGPLQPLSVSIALIINATQVRSDYTVSVITMTNTNTYIDQGTKTFQVTPGPLVFLRIDDEPSGTGIEITTFSLSVGQSKTLYAVGYDAFNNYIDNVSVTWSVTNNIGTVFPNDGTKAWTTFSASNVGTGIVSANDGLGHVDNTGMVTINAGPLASIKILEGSTGDGGELLDYTMTTDQSLTVHAAGYDANDNYTGDVPVNWSLSDSIGVITPESNTTSSIFYANRVGTGRIQAIHPSAGNDQTGEITINVGKLRYVKVAESDSGNTIELDGATVRAGDTLIVHAVGFDADYNYIGDLQVDWQVENSIGIVNPQSNSTFTHFMAQQQGTGYLRAVHGTVGNDLTGPIRVIPGMLHHLRLETGLANHRHEVPDTTVNINRTLNLYAAGYDEFDNYIRDVGATWKQIGSLDFPDSLIGDKIAFTPVTPTTEGRIYCDSINTLPDTTGLIRIGSASQVIITTIPGQISTALNDTTISADESLTLFASGFDGEGNYVGTMLVDWEVEGLEPDSGLSSTSFTFNATTANLNGKIFARHATVADDSTGIISVIPGLPSGRFQLLPESLEMSSNSADTINFSSSHIKDSDNNIVSYDHLMIVNVSPSTLGLTILPVDEDPVIPGHQIRLNGESKLNFQIAAGDKGGTVSISATSMKGTARADTSILVSGLRVLSINSVTDSVSQGQEYLNVNMLIKNTGTTKFHSLISRLKFYSATNENVRNDYLVEDITVDTLDIGEERVLTFPVSILPNATTGKIFLDGYVQGFTLNGVSVQDTSATSPHSWLVMEPARLSVVEISAPDIVEQGTVVTVYMKVKNNGEATAIVHMDSLYFYADAPYVDVTTEYNQIPKHKRPYNLHAGESKTLEYTVTIGTNSSKGFIFLDGKVRGVDKNLNLALSDLNADTTDVWEVKRKGEIVVRAFQPSQEYINSGQLSSWYVTMELENTFATMDMFLDSTKLEFYAGTDNITSQFNIVLPAQFIEFSGTDTLFSNSTQTLLFTINGSSDQALGNIRMKGYVYLSDKAHKTLTASSENQVIIKTPSVLNIREMILSQNEVTIAQQTDWYVKCVLENVGNSPIELLCDSEMTNLSFSSPQGFIVEHDSNFVISGTTIITAQAVDTLIFTIDRTGETRGYSTINLMIHYIDQIAVYDTLSASNTDHLILIETAPHLRIKESKNMAINAPSVNTNQAFDLLIVLENIGDDAANEVVLYVETNGYSTISPLAPFTLAGNSVDSLYVGITADDNWTFNERFTTSIPEVHGDNTQEFDSLILIDAIDDTAKAVIQRPAEVMINTLLVPSKPVKALSSDWQVKTVVERLGAGPVEFNSPDENSIKFYHNTIEQADYFVTRPTKFEHSGTLILSGWDEITDTLIFEIDQTGLMSGVISVEVNLTGIYLNNDSTFTINMTALLNVESTANVRILKTDAICPNKQDEVGILSTGQNYQVQVTLQNTGDEDVEDVHIVIDSGSNIYQRTINTISKQGQYAVNFPLQAPASAGRLQFTSIVESAISSLSGTAANISPAVDSTVVFLVESKAALRVNLYEEDAVLTQGRLCPVRYVVENLGTADTDSSGKVMVSLPEGYKILMGSAFDSNNVIMNFITGKIDTLSIWPPDESSSGDLLQVTINAPPKDINMGLPAYVESHLDTLYLRTVSSAITVDSYISWPTGATDKILSTTQLFDVHATIYRSDNIKSVQASISLPYGYSLDYSEDSVKSVTSETIKWRLRSPEVEHLENRILIIKTVGFIGENEYITSDTLEVKCEKKAQLYITDVGIISPSQTDSTLVVNQSFTVSATVINEGSASVIGKGMLRISFGVTGVTTLQDTIKQFTVGFPVLWDLRAPTYISGTSKITFTIVDVPDDENSNQKAGGLGDRRTISVKTVNKGFVSIDSLKIIEPAGATDGILSTSQTFAIKAYTHWDKCDNLPILTINMPDNFITEIESKYPSGTSYQGSTTWSITTPTEPILETSIWVEALAHDLHSGEAISAEATAIQIDVINRAEISLIAEIVSPIDAIDGIVTTNQPFVVQAYLWRSGDADLEDYYTVRLTLPSGGGYKTTDARDKRVLHDEKVSWVITAPPTTRDVDIIQIDLIESPHDENTNQQIAREAVIEDSRALPIATEEKKVDITLIGQKEQNTFARGDTNISMFTFRMLVSGDENSSRVLFLGLRLTVKNRSNELLDQVERAISRISLVTNNQNDHILGTVENMQGSGSIMMSFVSPDTLFPADAKTYEVMVDISDQASITDFQVSIDSLSYFNLVDISSGSVPLLSTMNNQTLTSGFTVIAPKDFEEAFWNYPNPFGSAGNEITTFQYFLDQDSDVQITVHNLLGELVWSKRFLKSEPQGAAGLHDGVKAIHWDGTNDGGEKVLNGVYIAYIRTDYGKSAVAKIALLK